jgi:putative membrane protein
MKNILLALSLVAALIFAGCSQNRANPRDDNGANQTTATDQQNGNNDNMKGGASDKLAPSDEEFAQKAATGGQAEVALGQLASEKATSPKVKEFAQRMVSDHGQANQQLEQIAGNKKLDLPKMLPTEAQEEQDKLSKMSGAQFDKEYMRFMVEDHQKDAQEFQQAASSVTDNDLKQFATQTLPIIQEHLKMAKQMAGKK